jgi:hypothetical protein
MSTTTTNLGLIKPQLTDSADITAMNENWDKIDEKLHNAYSAENKPSPEDINAAGANHSHAGQAIKPAYIEFGTDANTGHGGVLDFHFNGSTEDFTSRITESEKGKLNLLAENGVVAAWCPAGVSAVRNSKLVSKESNPTNNGEICWTYE